MTTSPQTHSCLGQASYWAPVLCSRPPSTSRRHPHATPNPAGHTQHPAPGSLSPPLTSPASLSHTSLTRTWNKEVSRVSERLLSHCPLPGLSHPRLCYSGWHAPPLLFPSLRLAWPLPPVPLTPQSVTCVREGLNSPALVLPSGMLTLSLSAGFRDHRGRRQGHRELYCLSRCSPRFSDNRGCIALFEVCRSNNDDRA